MAKQANNKHTSTIISAVRPHTPHTEIGKTYVKKLKITNMTLGRFG